MKNLGIFRFLFVALMVFCGCGITSHMGMYHYTYAPLVENTIVYPVYIDQDYGQADQIEIANAIDQWNYVLNGHAKLLIVSTTFNMEVSILRRVRAGQAFAILKINGSNPIVHGSDYVIHHNEHLMDSWSLGFTPQIGSHIVYLVRDRIPENNMVRGLIMHELGHALGAHHHSEGLMSTLYDAEMFQCIDYSTAKDVADYHHWNIDTMNYCIVGLSSWGNLINL